MKTPIDLEYSCHYCHSTRGTFFFATERMLGLGGEFTYSSCNSCGSLQILEIPKDLSNYYPRAYYSFQSLQFSGYFLRLVKHLRMQVYLTTGIPFFCPPFGGDWLQKLKLKPTDRIADVGCGSGQLLYELSVSGFRDLHGFDPYLENSPLLPAGLQLWNLEFDQTDLHFDVVMLHHSFEHMADPKSILTTCFDRLTAGGRLLIRCPVADAAVWQEKESLWVQLDAPRHLSIPSTNGFVELAQQIGFEVNEILFDSTSFQFWGTNLYENGEKLDQTKIKAYFSQKQMKAWEQQALEYNRQGKGDQVCFFCVKPDKLDEKRA